MLLYWLIQNEGESFEGMKAVFKAENVFCFRISFFSARFEQEMKDLDIMKNPFLFLPKLWYLRFSAILSDCGRLSQVKYGSLGNLSTLVWCLSYFRLLHCRCLNVRNYSWGFVAQVRQNKPDSRWSQTFSPFKLSISVNANVDYSYWRENNMTFLYGYFSLNRKVFNVFVHNLF